MCVGDVCVCRVRVCVCTCGSEDHACLAAKGVWVPAQAGRRRACSVQRWSPRTRWGGSCGSGPGRGNTLKGSENSPPSIMDRSSRVKRLRLRFHSRLKHSSDSLAAQASTLTRWCCVRVRRAGARGEGVGGGGVRHQRACVPPWGGGRAISTGVIELPSLRHAAC